jgi:hypothetical protein
VTIKGIEGAVIVRDDQYASALLVRDSAEQLHDL